MTAAYFDAGDEILGVCLDPDFDVVAVVGVRLQQGEPQHQVIGVLHQRRQVPPHSVHQ